MCGDVFFNMHLLTTMLGLRQPPGPFIFDPPLNRESERQVAALEPRVAGFGHGPVIADGTAPKLSSFVAACRLKRTIVGVCASMCGAISQRVACAVHTKSWPRASNIGSAGSG